MLKGRLREQWRARERAVAIYPVMTFAPDGLVLGAGTVLLEAKGPGRLQSLRGQEARVLALLAAAYGKAVAPAVLGNIERAVKSWRDGDLCLAHIHLAHSGLCAPSELRAAACRLFIAECAMQAGMSPHSIFQALNIASSYVDAIEKAYNSDEPRVPAGSGRTSGEWTEGAETSGEEADGEGAGENGAAGSSLLGRMPPPAASFLGALDATEATELAAYASRILGPVGAAVAAFGLLFVPSPNNLRVEGEVPEIPGLRYSWNRDETMLHLTYDDPDGGQHTYTEQLDGDVFRDAQGRVVGRILSDSAVAIDAAAVSSDLVDDDTPRLCPDTTKDKRTNDLGLDYENYIKSIVNPENPTPSYMGYVLPNLTRMVSFDDCEHSTVTMIEIKDGYAEFLESNWGKTLVEQMFVAQAMDQIQSAGTRPVRWYFSQKQVADYAEEIFSKYHALQNIEVKFEPWLGSER